MGDEIKAWLKDNERSQEWLARQVKYSVFTINHIIHGRSKPSIKLLEDLRAVTGLALEQPEDLSLNSNGKEKE
tara:strand:- start:221 stop:439 length:219 start_codon:yes stop_codon:yes gene_type:complete